MSISRLICWKCYEPLQAVAKPFPRLEACRKCGADLHVCRLCRHFAPQYSSNCGHETAEPARDTETANFCHFFAPVRVAQISSGVEGSSAKEDLQALFGNDDAGDASSDEAIPSVLQDLFGENTDD